jgi:hypothetical protein
MAALNDEEFELDCHCGRCKNGAMVTVVDGKATFEWEVDGETGVTELAGVELAAALDFAEFNFGGSVELWIDIGTADELRAWLKARGVMLPAAEAE